VNWAFRNWIYKTKEVDGLHSHFFTFYDILEYFVPENVARCQQRKCFDMTKSPGDNYDKAIYDRDEVGNHADICPKHRLTWFGTGTHLLVWESTGTTILRV